MCTLQIHTAPVNNSLSLIFRVAALSHSEQTHDCEAQLSTTHSWFTCPSNVHIKSAGADSTRVAGEVQNLMKHSLIWDVPLVESCSYRMPGGVIVGDSGLCCCGLAFNVWHQLFERNYYPLFAEAKHSLVKSCFCVFFFTATAEEIRSQLWSCDWRWCCNSQVILVKIILFIYCKLLLYHRVL